MIQNKILKREVEYWNTKSQYYSKLLFRFNYFIEILDALSIEQSIPEKEIVDFIDGLCGLPTAKTEKQYEEINLLLMPIFKRLIDTIKTNKYKRQAVKKNLKGQHYNQNGLKIKLETKADKILELMPKETILITGKEDSIDKAVSAYIKYWNNLLGSQIQKPRMTAPLFTVCLYFLKGSNYINGSLPQMFTKTKKLLNISTYTYSTIKKEFYNIGKGKYDPLNTKNILNSLDWLNDFPEGAKKARKILQSFE